MEALVFSLALIKGVSVIITGEKKALNYLDF
jgi:hypothetical protein